MNLPSFLKPRLTRKGRLFQLALFGLAAALAVVFLSATGIYRCPLRWTFGISCPGCGMTRAAASLLRLDFASAWRMHPLVFVVAGVLLLFGWAWVSGRLELLRSRWFWRGLAVLFLVWWGIQIVRFLQGQAPGFLEPEALFPRIVRLFGRFI